MHDAESEEALAHALPLEETVAQQEIEQGQRDACRRNQAQPRGQQYVEAKCQESLLACHCGLTAHPVVPASKATPTGFEPVSRARKALVLDQARRRGL